MADIQKIWVYKSSRYNDKSHEIEYFYKCDLQIEGSDGVSMNIDIPDSMAKDILKIIAPAIKNNLKTNLESLENGIEA